MMSNTNNSSALLPPGGVKYVYDLPFFDRKEICRIFDENNQWETLGGGLMGYSTSELSEFGRALYRGGSPTDALLTAWGNQNHTALELFTLCARLYHGRAMKVLAKYVDPKYHAYIPDADFQATQELVGIDQPKPLEPPETNIPKKLEEVDPTKKGGAVPGADGKGNKAPLSSLSESVGLLPQIPYAELTTATSGWDKRNILGKGGFGTVYKGLWKNTAVAIKRMEQQRSNEAYVESQMKQSLGEMKFLNSYRHDNILPLYGFSMEGPHPCLVYQFMTNGSLEDRILCRQRTPPLSWHLRFHIAKGVACGIQFLHSIGPQSLIHGDIKSANILLDRNFEAKVGDFGLAREMTNPGALNASYVKVSRVHGTRPYLPDEYLRSKKLSTKVDTYSFGIVLFELATGLRAYEEHRAKKFLKDMVEDFDGITDKLKDVKGGHDNPDVFPVLLNLGRHCTERLPKKRPEMVEVLKSLEAALPHATSSIRTISTHVTGLPYLFELPMSRPGSLGIPVLTSYSTNRNSPEMRAGAGSPHWVGGAGAAGQAGPGPQGFPSGIPSPGGVRKISQNSPPLPGSNQNQQYQQPNINQNYQPQNHLPEPIPIPGGGKLPPSTQTSSNNSNNNNPPIRSIGLVSPSSNSNNSSVPLMVMTPLSIDTTTSTPQQQHPIVTTTAMKQPYPEFLLIQPSPQITSEHQQHQQQYSPQIQPSLLPMIPTPCLPIQEDIHDDEYYLPLVLEHRPSIAVAAAVAAEMDPCLPGGENNNSASNSSATTQEQLYELDTVIPLITELGFINQDKKS